MASDDVVTSGDPKLDYTLQEIGQSMFDIKVRIAADEKKIHTSAHCDEETFADEEAENMVISADISRVLVIGPKLKPRSIHVTGMIHEIPGTRFDIDLFLLQVEGPDVILGVQWLQDLGKVLLDFRDLTMEFLWNQSPVILKGEDKPPKQISYNSLFSLIGRDHESDIFEIIPLGSDYNTAAAAPADLDPTLASAIEEFGAS
ncbi:hypothetical protein SASPL_109095 [Salvia splendens]|uniref:Uncharacterized protein n=1 Tax=Salvia splendens TaxID=180675 RepID=A0A8X8YFP0_SALSN|nr:hypothetical protein SASPL_109095 [Salvia splendens]